jgi:curved DNA-binding protein CbpA
MGNQQSFNNEKELEQQKKLNEKPKKSKKVKKVKKKNILIDNESIIDFDNDYNAYEILGVENNCNDFKKIKSNYYKLALQYHPDKNNGVITDHFIIIKEAYKYIKSIINHQNQFQHKLDADVIKQDYNVQNYDSNRKNIHLDSKNFNQEKFNEVFNENRLCNAYDKGYGDLKEENDELIQGEQLNNFTIDYFNNSFNKIKKKVNKHQIINYNGPEANYNCNMSFNELGIDEIDDFGESNKFTDYRKAYSSQSVLINENDIQQRKHYKNLNDYKYARDNLNLSNKEKEKYDLMFQQQKYLEKERIEKQKQQDMMITQNFNRMNSYLIIDR